MAGGYEHRPAGVEAIAAQFRAIQKQQDDLRKMIVGLGIQIDGTTGDLVFTADTGRLLVQGPGGAEISGGGSLTVDDGGDVNINDGGTLNLRDVNGDLVAEIGTLSDGPSTDVGIRLIRTGSPGAGTNALRFRGGFIGFQDFNGTNVVSDDIVAGGLATPYVPLGLPVDTNIATWPATTNTAYTAISACYVERQNPGFFWVIDTEADAATTGQFQILIDGAVVATSPTVTNAFALWTGTYFWPAGWTFNSIANLTIQAKATGTGTVRATTLLLTGIQSP